MNAHANRGVVSAIGAAALFGAGTPVAKLLLAHTSPWLLAGLLYLGSGIGLFLYRVLSRAPGVKLARAELSWLAGAVLAGGVVGPLLLMKGLAAMAAADASLLLNAEAVFTALLAWCVFKENVDARIAAGMGAIVLGAVVLSWPHSIAASDVRPALMVLGACVAWAVDNNLTRKVSVADASFIAMIKGLAAGSTNLVLAVATGATWPSFAVVAGAGVLGFLSYGTSLVLFVVALRHLGTARTGAYFSVAPFFGALLAIGLLGEPLTLQLGIAGVLMGIGVWLHLTERHAHPHAHEPMEHSHEHEHDAHHHHGHADGAATGLKHTHWHRHDPVVHSHEHYPDIHHQHAHRH